jgi:glycogen synthase
MNILMVASECIPFVKVGGLADVVGTLPKYLKKARHDNIYGILNGIDYSYWNPATDKNIKENYLKDNLKGKAICKEDLQKLCGFDVKKDTYLLGCVSRLQD